MKNNIISEGDRCHYTGPVIENILDKRYMSSLDIKSLNFEFCPEKL